MKPRNLPWSKYLFYGSGRRLSLIGETLGIQWLIYNPIHFWHFHGHAIANAPGVIDALIRVFPAARKWIDVGAGTGGYAAEAKRRGINISACENNSAGRRLARKQGVSALEFDLSCEAPAATQPPYDLAYCFEVAEHLPPHLGERLIYFLTQQAPVIVFSAAHPGQGGTGHINEQPKEYWLTKFERLGYRLQGAKSDLLVEYFRERGVPGSWFIDNTMVICK